MKEKKTLDNLSKLLGISPDALVGLLGTIIGTFLGWLLSCLGNSGKMKIQFDDVDCIINDDYYDGVGCFKLYFLMRIINNKNRTYGINQTAIYLKPKRKQPIKFGTNIFSDGAIGDADFSMFLNIPMKETKEEQIECSHTFEDLDILKQGYKIYLKYKFNGKKFSHKRIVYRKTVCFKNIKIGGWFFNARKW